MKSRPKFTQPEAAISRKKLMLALNELHQANKTFAVGLRDSLRAHKAVYEILSAASMKTPAVKNALKIVEGFAKIEIEKKPEAAKE